jgi:hypothetical protein
MRLSAKGVVGSYVFVGGLCQAVMCLSGRGLVVRSNGPFW